MPVCPKCGSSESEDRISEVVCTGCGLLLDTFLLGPSDPFDGILVRGGELPRDAGRGPRHSSTSATDRINTERAVKSLLEKLDLSVSRLLDRVLEIYGRARLVQKEPYVVLSVLQGTAVCIACREEEIPVFLADIAVAVGCSTHVFGAALRRVEEELNYKPTGAALESFVRSAALTVLNNKAEQARTVSSTALKVYDWLEDVALTKERELSATPFVLAACSLQLACEAHKVTCRKQQLADAFRISVPTLNRALATIRRYLLKLAHPLPWLSKLNEKTVASRILTFVQMETAKQIVSTALCCQDSDLPQARRAESCLGAGPDATAIDEMDAQRDGSERPHSDDMKSPKELIFTETLDKTSPRCPAGDTAAAVLELREEHLEPIPTAELQASKKRLRGDEDHSPRQTWTQTVLSDH